MSKIPSTYEKCPKNIHKINISMTMHIKHCAYVTNTTMLLFLFSLQVHEQLDILLKEWGDKSIVHQSLTLSNIPISWTTVFRKLSSMAMS